MKYSWSEMSRYPVFCSELKLELLQILSEQLLELKIWDEVLEEKMRQQCDFLLFSQLTVITKYSKYRQASP